MKILIDPIFQARGRRRTLGGWTLEAIAKSSAVVAVVFVAQNEFGNTARKRGAAERTCRDEVLGERRSLDRKIIRSGDR